MKPTLDDVVERSHVVSLPMAVPFRGVTQREALLIEGPAGWGEFSPFLEYGPAESAHWLAAGIEAAFEGLPEATGSVEVNGTVPAVEAGEVEAVLERFPGVRTFKIKVAQKGQSLDDDLSRVAAVRALRPDARLRVDANRGWSVDQAVEAARALGELEYIEQPCATAEELAAVRARVDTPIAADESIRRAADPYRVAALGAADVAVVKVAPLGGVRRLVRISHELGLDVTVASALDTAVGISAGLVAAKLTGSRAAGLATQRLFSEDVCAPRPIVGGAVEVAPATPDPERLHSLRARRERRDWWVRRVGECFPYLEG
ncbi:o-succinylbenzoate synthase [Corynebacterium liangguodongii]|uniref:o-succinylbenzoate synthase n=1 Tax=Corynebacterium liangguodongii TaxID=2079535 RepID=A0A2S0WC48_9CORY|nr:o-succinylbenzoate synthase [Corynebacterium liangguodongii]AWB83324.1 O-succinylbenzoate synthase [Corynebacterium liangguodongii]PWC00586.1 O-succinylbenzoate synthase [Corynebacterium liangguodongii]